MSRIAFMAVAAGVCIAVAFGCGKNEPAANVHDTGQEIVGDPQAVVATVGGVKITLAELDLLSSYWMDRQSPETRRAVVLGDLQHRALDKLIEQILLVGEAERRGFSVPDSVVQRNLREWESAASGDQTLEQRLEKCHVSRETVAEHLRRDAIIQQMVVQIMNDSLALSDAEVRAYYSAHPDYFDNKQVRASHILLGMPAGSPPESLAAAEQRINALYARLQNGEDFATLARKYSTCPSAPQGGDLGLTGRGRWVKPFEDAAFSLNPGEISKPVRTDFGYHIIKVTDVVGGTPTPFDDVKVAIAQYLRNEKTQQAVDRLADRLRASADIREFISKAPSEG